MYIGHQQIVAFLGKDRDDQWHMMSEQRWHVPRNIHIKKGDEIRIDALSETGSRVIFDYLEFTESNHAGSVMKKDLVMIFPEEYEHAIKNPLKGFRPSTIYSGLEDRDDHYTSEMQTHEYGTLIKNYFRWNELEHSADDDVNRIREVCNAKWKGIEEHNIKIIPRVYLAWPRRATGWPGDMTTGNFTSDHFRERVIALIKKLGEAWDEDPRVAYVEMGLIGEWGEMEWPDTKDEIKAEIASQFAASFRNKLVMIRWPNTYNDDIYNFGYYWDSFPHHDQEYYACHLDKTAPRWKTAPVGGEAAYNWGNVKIQPGESPDVSLSVPQHLDYIIDEVRKLHANHLGWIANYDHDNEMVRSGAEMLQKAMGYRFVIEEAVYPRRIRRGEECTLSLRVRNTGSSPFYYNWPVELSLLDPDTKQPVWKQLCDDLDIRDWLPGDQWDEDADAYKIPAESILVNQPFIVPEDIPAGEYILALTILDPSGNQPAVRFAIKNYYNGGRHPLGKAGIDYAVDSFEVSGFDDIQGDRSLSYSKLSNKN